MTRIEAIPLLVKNTKNSETRVDLKLLQIKILEPGIVTYYYELIEKTNKFYLPLIHST